MPAFRGEEFDRIRSWIFDQGRDLFVIHDKRLMNYLVLPYEYPGKTQYIKTTQAEAKHALRVLGCISGAFKTQGESNT